MELTIEQALQQAVTAHKEGELEEAERLYRAILQSQPAHPDANHNLGVIAVSVNKANAALPFFKSALEANPKIEQFWLSYIGALLTENKTESANTIILEARKKGFDEEKINALEKQLQQLSVSSKTPIINKKLTLKEKRQKTSETKEKKKRKVVNNNSPSPLQVKNLVEQYQKGRYEEAEKLAASITQEFPEHFFAWKVLGAVFNQTGRVLESLDAKHKAVELAPQDAEAHSNLANSLQELSRFDEAEVSYRKVIAIKPDDAQAHSNLGITLKKLGRFAEAEESYRKAIALKPEDAQVHSNLGNTLKELGRFAEAEESYRKAIALKDNFSIAHNNLGSILQERGKLAEAEKSYRKAIALQPDYPGCHQSLGSTLQKLGRLVEAEASYKQAIALKPDLAEAHFNLGSLLNKLGRLDEAVECYKTVSTINNEDTLGVSIQLASMGLESIPNRTPKTYMKSYYQKKSKLWDLVEGEQYKGHALIRKAIQHVHNNIEKINILDLGCGTGSLASFLHTYACVLHGVDISPDMLIEATKTGLYDSLSEQDVELFLEKTTYRYDMIVAAALMVHFLQLESLFSLIHNKLNPNGKVVFSVFEGINRDKELNSFLMYSHSHNYITKLAETFSFEISYQDQGVHEYHEGKPINALIYVLTKLPQSET